jgi:Fe-S-cluster-containing dehydrogenase component
MARYGMLIDLESCNGCRACMTACKGAHNIPFGQHQGREYYRIWPDEVELGTYPYVVRNLTPFLCMHCEHPPCVDACQVPGAIHRRPDGIVLIDEGKCNGCKLCIPACPYGALYFREDKGNVDKCTFCVESVDRGLQPVCARVCPVDAILFGDLDDPNSQVRKRIRKEDARPLHPEYGTKPSVYYQARAARLRGVVENKETGHPIPGATVVAKCLEEESISSARTDSDGVFFFWSLKSRKKYWVTVEVNGFSQGKHELYLDTEYKDWGTIPISEQSIRP